MLPKARPPSSISSIRFRGSRSGAPADFAFAPGQGVAGYVVASKLSYCSNEPARDPLVLPELQRRLRVEQAAELLAGSRHSLADIAVGCALGYLDFRFGYLQWRDNHPHLAQLHSGFALPPSRQVQKTRVTRGSLFGADQGSHFSAD